MTLSEEQNRHFSQMVGFHLLINFFFFPEHLSYVVYIKTLFVSDDYTIFPLPVQTSSVQTDHEAVRRARNQEEGKGSKGHAWKVNGFISNLVFVRKRSVLTDDANIEILNGYTFPSKCYICYCRSIHSQRHGYICHVSGKGQERKKLRQLKKQSARESGRKTLRCVPFPTASTHS